jgi:dimethylhistidine N-methyltransferase
VLIDLGAGNCAKAQRLFPALQPAQYVAVDLDVALLEPALTAIQQRHPRLSVVGVGCDLARPLELPPVVGAGRLAFYPGSSIGNFDHAAAIALLARIRAAVQPDGWLLIGFDLCKSERWLRPAYDDALQVTAAFNRNVLRHVNRVLGSDFDLADWRHEVRCLPDRVQMHLQAQHAVSVHWADGARAFEAGEAIHTEDSFKYTVAGFTTMLERAGLHAVGCWTDPRQWFALMLARAP